MQRIAGAVPVHRCSVGSTSARCGGHDGGGLGRIEGRDVEPLQQPVLPQGAHNLRGPQNRTHVDDQRARRGSGGLKAS